MHNEPDALFVGVFVQCGQVKVRVGGEEVKHELFLLSVPVFPTDVPAFDEQTVETVGGGKVDVAAHVGVVRAVRAVGLGVFIVGLAEFYRWEVVGVAPSAFAGDHLPPHAHVLHWVNPAYILQSARLVEVEDETRGQHIGGTFADHHGSPRSGARCLDAAFVAGGVGTQPCTERISFWLLAISYWLLVRKYGHRVPRVDGQVIQEFKMHRGVVERGSLVDVDVEPVVGFHLQRRLHARFRESSPRPAAVLVPRLP